MKQKIVTKVEMNCLKCRKKALEIAASADGVDSVAIEGKDEDRVVVIGDEVDPISLVSLLRKKVGHTEVISVEAVKPKEGKEVKVEVLKEPFQWINNYDYHHPQTLIAYYEPQPTGCSIM